MMGEMKVKSYKNIYKGYATMRMIVIRSHGGDESQREANDVRSKTRQGNGAAHVLAGINEYSECIARVVVTRGIREPLQLWQKLYGDSIVYL